MTSEQKTKTTKSLAMFGEIHHIWLSMSSYTTMDINVSDGITNTNYVAAEFDGLRYQIKNPRVFNDVFVKAMKEKPTLVKMMFHFFREQTEHPDNLKELKIKFDCFKRRVNIYIYKKARKTKELLWD